MNPFDLRGPDFLMFYAALGILVVAIVWFWRRSLLPKETLDSDLSDPYLIACLRGGPDEALRVATCSLLDRGLLRSEATLLAAVRPDGAYLVQRPIERALMKEYSKPREASEMFRSPLTVEAARELEDSLIERGLTPSRGRRTAATVGMLVLIGVAGIKILVALSRGRMNVLFLILFAVAFVMILSGVAALRQTFRGLRTLADLRTLFAGRRALATSRGDMAFDLALLTGVFGLAVANTHAQGPEFRKLFPKSANERGVVTHSWSSCGSSFGSSSSSCGSSCGGGGCGGGCGGCGS